MKRISLFTLGLTCLILAGLLTTQAGPSASEPAPPRPQPAAWSETPFLDLGRVEPASPSGPAALDTVSWSKLVFQSYRDDNWEIYLANGDGSGQTRLTSNDDSDIQPRLNRGCTRTVLTSNRTGSYHLFTMNLDGSGVTQLTFGAADDFSPAWSPDESKIAFQTDRDGQAEIYVMNADGSAQTRLTWDAEYDGTPTWSPDGAKIAFISRRTGGYRVWVMNADGSGQTQLSTQSYSADPAWSPDGSQIAYDSDGDGDGWQELWLMNADGSNQREVYDPGGTEVDAWASSWSADGRYVAFTTITFIYYQGNWYWVSAYLDAWDSTSGGKIWLGGAGVDWRPHWATTDVVAPASKVDALPTYSRGTAAVSWSGSDSGDAGIKAYDVQYQDTAVGDWVDWQVEITSTSAIFAGMGGHTYDFRSRAIDKAYNVEDWQIGNGDASTTLYNWAIEGTVRDNRDMPLAGVTVTTLPSALEANPSDGNGNFFARVGDSADTYSAIWVKSKYGELPSANFDASQDVQIDVILPPADNVVQNWGFESGSFQAGNWLVTGIVSPQVTNIIKHTGNYAALLGQQPAYVSKQKVSIGSGWSDYPQLAVDNKGIVHLVWAYFGSGDSDIYYTQRRNDGSWSSPENISKSDAGPLDPEVAVDKSGAVHVVWRNGFPSPGVFYAQRSPEGVWSDPENISNISGMPDYPRLAIDSQGRAIHVLFSTPHRG